MSPSWRPRIALLVCVPALAALPWAMAEAFTSGGTLRDTDPLDHWYPIALGFFAVAVVALRSVRRALVPFLVLAGTVAVLATGLLEPPRTSDDSYRYLWDGRVQAEGISPYAHPPAAPELAELRARAPELFPVGTDCKGWDLRKAKAGFCSHVNRPTVPTIYPPVAEGYFAVLYRLGGGYGVRAAQVGGAVLALSLCALLLWLLPSERRWQAALWGWFPGVTVWAVNDAHVDTLGVLLVVGGLALAARGRLVGGGALLGAAIATKLIPALAVPGAMSGMFARRPRLKDLVLPVTALAVVALTYVPHVLASGSGVLGYLPGYLKEEGYDSEKLKRFALLRQVVSEDHAAIAAAVMVLAAVLYVLRFGDPLRPWSGALLVFGVALLALTPGYPWYGLLLVGLIVLDGRWEWLGVPMAGQVVYLHGLEAQDTAYGLALAAVVGGQALRTSVPRLRARRSAGPGRPIVPAR
ncbi:hypothetical protein ABGB12_18515 [Actinocorallia sp. B10E7]|uniref:hypothetical protein n=1 Tax=Actinocorallia sp. B10E7 TaxID=3153558 RepID=UPI00325F50A4